MAEAAGLPDDILARRCAEETERYAQREAVDPSFCFELLRRAFALGSEEAVALVYQVYERRVLAWVYSHTRFASTGEDAEFFASWAFHNCYRALQGEKFARFPTLAHILAYLKLCVHTAIVHYLRDQGPAAAASIDQIAEPSTPGESGIAVETAELWASIMRLLPEQRDRLLARCVFVLDLKPRQIVAAFPGVWRDVREVTVAIFRIRQLLRRDPELCRLAGLPEPGTARERG